MILNESLFEEKEDNKKYFSLGDRIGMMKRKVKEKQESLKEEVIGQVPEENPSEEPTEQQVENGLASMINDLVIDEFEAITGYNDALSTLSQEDLERYSDIIPVIKDIISEEYTHVGQLQEVLRKITQPAEDINKGVTEAEGQM